MLRLAKSLKRNRKLTGATSFFQNQELHHVPKGSLNIVDYRVINSKFFLLRLQNGLHIENIAGNNFECFKKGLTSRFKETNKDLGGIKLTDSDFITKKQTISISNSEKPGYKLVNLKTENAETGKMVSKDFTISKDQVIFLLHLFNGTILYKREKWPPVHLDKDGYLVNQQHRGIVFSKSRKLDSMFVDLTIFNSNDQKHVDLTKSYSGSLWWKLPVINKANRGWKLSNSTTDSSVAINKFDDDIVCLQSGKNSIPISIQAHELYGFQENITKPIKGEFIQAMNDFLSSTNLGEIPERFLEPSIFEIIQLNFRNITVKFVRNFSPTKTCTSPPIIEFQVVNSRKDRFSVNARFFEKTNKYIYQIKNPERDHMHIDRPPTDNRPYIYFLPDDQGAIYKYEIQKIGDCEIDFEEIHIPQLVLQQIEFIKYAVAQGFLVFDSSFSGIGSLKFTLENGKVVNVISSDEIVQHDMDRKINENETIVEEPKNYVANDRYYRTQWGIANPPRRTGVTPESIQEFVTVLNMYRSITHKNIIVGESKSKEQTFN